MKTRIYNIIILDESGSMERIKQTAVDGCNETIQTIRTAQQKYKEEQQHYVILVTFNTSEMKILYNCLPVHNVSELTDCAYRPNAGTPLFDTMGTILSRFRYSLDESGNCKVLVTVITDGEENASVEYSGQMVKKMIDELKNLGWVFTYIGANQDVYKVASSLSINNVMNFTATTEGTQAMFKKESKCRTHFYDQVEEERQGKGAVASHRYFFDIDDNE